MPNRMLTPEELKTLFAPLLGDVRARLKSLSGNDAALLFALRRKLYKELFYDERGKPMQRRVLKVVKYTEQSGKCKICGAELEPLGRNAVLDRAEAIKGYVTDNVRLICAACDRKVQAERGFA
jgi:hypothetical protein